MPVRLGIVSPIVTRVPGRHGAWEADAGIQELATIARAAERLGYHHVTCSEHVAVPAAVARQRGGTYWDPLATLGYLAAVTRRLRLVTQVLVLGYHHPLEIVKRYGTLDLVSGGRLVLGVGVGSLQEEFELLGAAFAGRGELADDALRAVREGFGHERPSYAGEFYAYDDLVVDPPGRQTPPPIWVGGRTSRSLRRAIALGDGWVPFGLNAAALRALLDAHDRPAGFDVVLPTGVLLDPAGRPEDCARLVEELEAAGATIVNCALAADSVEHYLEQLQALAELWGLNPSEGDGDG